jgi:hypothetical protein
MYPGAFSFVLGVEANAAEGRAGFSNFDQDGPVFSKYTDLLNYELKAPGTGILSCVPGGNYREYNGTSMAAPLVTGAVSLYHKQRLTESQELLFGNFINSISQHIDLEAALNIIPEPRLDIVSYLVNDTIDGDRDGRPDAGETIELIVKVRNTWGQANDVKVGIEFGEFEDQTTATILTSEASVGAVSAYAPKENKISIKLKLAANINDGRDIVFKLKTWHGDHLGERNQQITLNAENGIEVFGLIKTDAIWTNNNYKITGNLRIEPNVTLKIINGASISFDPNVSIDIWGKLIIIGTKTNPIEISSNESNFRGNGFIVHSNDSVYFNYVKFNNLNSLYNNISSGKLILRNCQINNCGYDFLNGFIFKGKVDSKYSNFNENIFYRDISSIINSNFEYNNFTENITGHLSALGFLHFNGTNIFKNNNSIFNSKTPLLWLHSSNVSSSDVTYNYWGTINDKVINQQIYDFTEDATLAAGDYKPILIKPNNLTHGIVWKVLVNGKDAQDEYDLLDPLGVGKQKMEVYFNRAMDIKIPPTVTMGVRYPFSQTAIAEEGSWSPDSTIYTVYGTIGLSTGDGINTIRVTGAKDMDHFEIPIEDRRFRVIVNAAGSLSEGFEATPGMGKVTLKWDNPVEGVSDLLGYNIYRYS